MATAPHRKPGRPKGSKNKPKSTLSPEDMLKMLKEFDGKLRLTLVAEPVEAPKQQGRDNDGNK